MIQDALLNRTFADLMSQLPGDIASDEEDTKEIINHRLVALLREQPRTHESFSEGLTIVNSDMVFFFSKEMVGECKQLLVPLVEEWCKGRAKAIASEGKTSAEVATTRELVPLVDVSAGVGERYPDLLDLQRRHESARARTSHGEEPLSWSPDEEDDATTSFRGPLAEFCRRALLSAELRRTCASSLKAELDRLDSNLRGVSVSARSEGAAAMRHAGESFEASFRTLCHLLQIFSKSLDTLDGRAQKNGDKDGGIDRVTVGKMKEELLLGCGSCLARLITEYCLFQHAGEIDDEGEGDSVLYFESHQEESEKMTGIAVPSYLQAVNMATLSFPSFELKCSPDRNGKLRDPSNYLRTTFPGSSGASLVQMWSLCSELQKNDDNTEVGRRNLESYTRHLSDTCLTLVGVPFSVLDKKTEKKVLASRREGILRRLENSRNEDEVFLCATVLIFHQIKNMPMAGIKTINLVVTRLFDWDKKIPREVTEALRSLTIADCNGSSSLIELAKKFGSAKNSKALAAIVAE